MTIDELRKALTYFVEKYVPGDEKKCELILYIEREEPSIPVKGILADLDDYLPENISSEEGKLIRDIYVYYC